MGGSVSESCLAPLFATAATTDKEKGRWGPCTEDAELFLRLRVVLPPKPKQLRAAPPPAGERTSGRGLDRAAATRESLQARRPGPTEAVMRSVANQGCSSSCRAVGRAAGSAPEAEASGSGEGM